MFGGTLTSNLVRQRWRRQRGPSRSFTLSVEGLEDRNLLSFSAPPTIHFGRDPAAVAVADFNRDGNQDFVVADDVGGTLTVELGNGDGTFRNAGSFRTPGGSEPILTVGDFNGDGIPDLAMGNYAGVGILLGNGDGTFRSAGVVSINGGDPITTSVAVADFNGDGKQDLVVTTLLNGGFELLGNGDGTFQRAIPLASFSDIQSVVAGDINNDGKSDVIGLNYAGQAVLFSGNGDGTFQSPVPFAPGFPLTVIDLNGNGIADLVLRTRSGISERLGNGDGTFQDAMEVTVPPNTPGTVLGVGDFDNDGQIDLVIQNRPFAGESHALSVLLNNGAGSVATAPAYATGAFPSAIATGDFNGDGFPDLVTVGFDGQAHVLLNNGDGTFRSAGTLPAPSVGTSVVVGDFNGDGQLDIAVLSRNFNGHSQVSVFSGRGDGSFQSAQIFDLGSGTHSSFGEIVAGDFDHDGRLDLAVLFEDNIRRQNVVEVLLGNGDGTFRAAEAHRLDTSDTGTATGLAVADFDGDGKLDIAVASPGNVNGVGARVNVFLGNGDGTFQEPVSISVRGGPFEIAVGDFNGDGIPDLITMNIFTNSVSVLLGNGDGTFRSPVTYQVGVEPAALVVGDFNGDGIPDVAVTNSFSNSVSVLLGNGDGTLQNAVNYLVGVDPRSLVAADFNGDGSVDLAVANFHSNDVSVLLNQVDESAASPVAALDALFGGANPEPVNRMRGPRQLAEAAPSAPMSGGMPDASQPAQQPVLVADILAHRRKEDRTEAAVSAWLVDLLLQTL